jgi:hypothetical protein
MIRRAFACKRLRTESSTDTLATPEFEHALCCAFVQVTPRSRSVRRVADLVGTISGRFIVSLIGFALIAARLGLTAMIVMLPMDLAAGLLGVRLFVGGFLVREDRAQRLDR